jgi:hypothetical protein
VQEQEITHSGPHCWIKDFLFSYDGEFMIVTNSYFILRLSFSANKTLVLRELEEKE